MTMREQSRCPACPSDPGGAAHGAGVVVVWAPSEATHLVMWRTPDGRRRRKRARQHTLASEIAADVAEQLTLARRFNSVPFLQHTPASPSRTTVPELIREFVAAEKDSRGWSASYVDVLDGLVRNHVSQHLNLPLTAWSEAASQRALDAARERLGPSKLSQLLSLLRQAAAYGLKTRRLVLDPTANLRVPMPRRHLTSALLDVDGQRVVAEVDDMPSTQALEAVADSLDALGSYGLAARVAGYAGSRFSETFALERGDVDFEAKTISIDRQVDDRARARNGTVMTPDGRRRRYWRTAHGFAALPKGDQTRRTLLPPQVLEEIQRLPDGLLFPNGAGNYIANQTWWNDGPFGAARELAGWPRTTSGRFVWTWHSLRHHAATWLLEQGIPIHDVSQLLGHSQIETTLRMYVHSDREAPRRAAERIERQLRNVVDPAAEVDHG